jgi:hypothetical protein
VTWHPVIRTRSRLREPYSFPLALGMMNGGIEMVPQPGFELGTHALRIRRSLARSISINVLDTSNAVHVWQKRGKSACAGTNVATANESGAACKDPPLHADAPRRISYGGLRPLLFRVQKAPRWPPRNYTVTRLADLLMGSKHWPIRKYLAVASASTFSLQSPERIERLPVFSKKSLNPGQSRKSRCAKRPRRSPEGFA